MHFIMDCPSFLLLSSFSSLLIIQNVLNNFIFSQIKYKDVLMSGYVCGALCRLVPAGPNMNIYSLYNDRLSDLTVVTFGQDCIICLKKELKFCPANVGMGS